MGTGLWNEDQEQLKSCGCPAGCWILPHPSLGLGKVGPRWHCQWARAPRSAFKVFTPHKWFNCYLFPSGSCQISWLPLAADAIAMISSCARSSLKWLLCWSKDPLLPLLPFWAGQQREIVKTPAPVPPPDLPALPGRAQSCTWMLSSEFCSGLLVWCVKIIKTGSLKQQQPPPMPGFDSEYCEEERWLSCSPLLRYHVWTPQEGPQGAKEVGQDV